MPTKPELEKENVDLQQKLAAANEELEERQRQDAIEQKRLADTIPDVEDTNDEILADPEVMHDPFAGQNPHAILNHPLGFMLGWKSELYRGRRGWRGWEKISYDDEYGAKLADYINDPPARMTHGTDMYVRRGDTILCRLPRPIWLERQKARVDKAMRLSREHGQDIQVEHVIPKPGMGSDIDREQSMLRGSRG